MGRRRYPALQAVCGLFAQGLAKNPDMIEELLTSPQDINTAVALDQAIGRIIYVGQLVSLGGETGSVLAGAAVQKMCDDAVADARARALDVSLPMATRSDIGVLFEEPFRLDAEEKQRRAEAQAKANQNAQPYQSRIDQSQQDGALSQAVDAYLSSAQNPGGNQK